MRRSAEAFYFSALNSAPEGTCDSREVVGYAGDVRECGCGCPALHGAERGRRLSSNTSPASEWRCSRGREISVTRCPDYQEAGVGAMTPDFRIPGTLKSEDRLERASEEPDAVNQDTEETTEAESGNQEKTWNQRRSQRHRAHEGPGTE
ncbi:hypothetical protein NDU88_001228 [Pleurodeles waltl]|uniref:Uncharacterized protein n=1 Tax=Pleurodeles waltl TaxID=8319 RepID=A0AAV7V7V4_PLEWA|nr:hypothetical protein NDU88_001228 [Pleurodeles waltl]